MSQKINETEKYIHDAYGVNASHLDEIAERMANICSLATLGKEPSGFLAKKVQETFSKDDLEMIATMFLIKTINQANDGESEDDCQCPSCKARRGEISGEEEGVSSIIAKLEKDFPGAKVMAFKVPKDGKTNC